jgi:hypothetical protein
VSLLVNRFPVQTGNAEVLQYLVTFPDRQGQSGGGGTAAKGAGAEAERGRPQVGLDERRGLMERLARQQGWQPDSWAFDAGGGMLFVRSKGDAANSLPEERREWRVPQGDGGGAAAAARPPWPRASGGGGDDAVVATQLHSRFSMAATAGEQRESARQLLGLLFRTALATVAPQAVQSEARGGGGGGSGGGQDVTALLEREDAAGGRGSGRGGGGGRGRGGGRGGGMGGLQVGGPICHN